MQTVKLPRRPCATVANVSLPPRLQEARWPTWEPTWSTATITSRASSRTSTRWSLPPSSSASAQSCFSSACWDAAPQSASPKQASLWWDFVLFFFVLFFAYLFTLKHSPHRPNGPLSHLPLFASPVLHGHRGDLCCRGVRLGVWLRLPQQGGFPVARRSLLICGLCRPGSKLEHLSLRVCPVKLRPGTLHDGRLRKVRRGGRRQQSRGVSADPGRCRSFTEIPLLAFRFRSPPQLLLLHPPAPPVRFHFPLLHSLFF